MRADYVGTVCGRAFSHVYKTMLWVSAKPLFHGNHKPFCPGNIKQPVIIALIKKSHVSLSVLGGFHTRSIFRFVHYGPWGILPLTLELRRMVLCGLRLKVKFLCFYIYVRNDDGRRSGNWSCMKKITDLTQSDDENGDNVKAATYQLNPGQPQIYIFCGVGFPIPSPGKFHVPEASTIYHCTTQAPQIFNLWFSKSTDGNDDQMMEHSEKWHVAKNKQQSLKIISINSVSSTPDLPSSTSFDSFFVS